MKTQISVSNSSSNPIRAKLAERLEGCTYVFVQEYSDKSAREATRISLRALDARRRELNYKFANKI